ncbi:MAG: GLPGLI family protein [Bacteroidota bacterium]|nr:GLPGLI family protein [Bacteroidota bacterium]
MRYLILLFVFLSPITLLAQSEGTVEYSMTSEMNMDIGTVRDNLPEGLELDSAMAVQMGQSVEYLQNQRYTVPVLFHYSGSVGLMEMVMPDLPTRTPNVSPFGSFDNSIGMTVYVDFEEQTSLTQLPSMGESVPYVLSLEVQKLDWVLVDVDSTILDHAVKKAEFVSDSLEVVAWYAPDIPTTVGPAGFGSLPGLPLSIDAVISQNKFMNVSLVAKSLTEGLEEPITPPVGIIVTHEEYMKIMQEEHMKTWQEKLDEDAQFVP